MIDKITLAIMANRLDGITHEMTSTMLRTARSTTMAARDFSCSITGSQHDLLSCPDGIPVHVYGSHLLAQSMAELHPDFREGDAFLHNDPYMGNSHAADHSLIVPVFFNNVHVFTAIAKAHQVDIGNSQPTTYMPSALDVYEEGALIFPCVKIQEDYRNNADIIRMCERRIRSFDTWYGDFLATMGAVRLAERRLKQFCNEFRDVEEIVHFQQQWLDYSETMAEHVIRSRLRSGRKIVSTKMDPYPNVPDGLVLNAAIDVDSVDGRVTIDLRDNPDCIPTGMNLTETTSKNAGICAVLKVLNSEVNAKQLIVPNNSGSHRRIEVIVRDNCVVGIPRHPFSCSTATRAVSDRVIGMVLLGMAEMAEGTGSAEPCYGCPPHEAVVSGIDRSRDDEKFVFQIFPGRSGGPATADSDGWPSMTGIPGAGMSMIDSAEVVEQRYPIVIWQRATVRIDSEGPGRFRGAPGSSSIYGPLHDSMHAYWYMDGVQNPSRGVHGGGKPLPAAAFHVRNNGKWEEIRDTVAAVTAVPPEALVSLGAGGGGYGDPRRRSADAVLQDVMEGFVSFERAREVYAVAIKGNKDRPETLELDLEETGKLRNTEDSINPDEGYRQEHIEESWWISV